MHVPAWMDRMLDVLHLHDRKRLLGLSFILAVAIIWVAASFIVQGIEGSGVSPPVLTLIANSLFSLYLPVYLLNLRLQQARAAKADAATGADAGDPSRNRSSGAEAERAALYPPAQLRSDAVGAAGAAGTAPDSPGASLEAPPTPEAIARGDSKLARQDMTRRQLLRAALIVAPLWYLAQLTFNASLAATSVTSNTILSSTSALFTFIFSMWLLSEAFTMRKLACIGLLIAGTAMVTVADSRASDSAEAAKRSVLGDALCLLSAIIYGGYTVAIRRLLHEDEETPMTLFFGYMGALILAGVGPLLLLAWVLGAPLGSLSWRQLGMVVAKGLLDNVLSDYLWARAILLVGPTIATGGLSVQVPLAVLVDALARSPPWLHSAGAAALTFLGGAVVLAGFLGLNAGDADDERGRARRWEERQAALQTELGYDTDEGELAEVAAGGAGGGRALAEAGPYSPSAGGSYSPVVMEHGSYASPGALGMYTRSGGSAAAAAGDAGSPTRQGSKQLKIEGRL